jgi:L-2-hydroxyglutarate oxidase LhgO
MDQVDCVVVGAGVVGLAITRALACVGREVLMIEAAEGLGAGTSGRGSGVIHAGLYYEPGSLKAKLCVAGRPALFAFAESHGVPYRRTGKLVVATSAEDSATLDAIADRARDNGVDDIVAISGTDARALEPALTCKSALLSPSTGVIDARALLTALFDDAETFGAVSAFSAPLLAADPGTTGFTLHIGGATPMRIRCRCLVNAAGHGAPAVARSIRDFPAAHVPISYFAKGNYFVLDGRAPFERLIYPVPVPGGIGTHLTLDVAGTARFGPDVEWVETLDYTVAPSRAASFYADIRRWWPGLPEGALRPSHAGIRPKISPPGAAGRDFVIQDVTDHGVLGLVNLFGIESPGLTASLAIGEHVAERLAI